MQYQANIYNASGQKTRFELVIDPQLRCGTMVLLGDESKLIDLSFNQSELALDGWIKLRLLNLKFRLSTKKTAGEHFLYISTGGNLHNFTFSESDSIALSAFILQLKNYPHPILEKTIYAPIKTFMFGQWKAYTKQDEAIIHFNLPASFPAHNYLISATDNSENGIPKYLNAIEIGNESRKLKLSTGNTAFVRGKGFYLMPETSEILSGTWSIPGLETIPFFEFTSISHYSTTKTVLIDLDTPHYINIHYAIDQQHNGEYIKIEIDGKQITGLDGNTQPLYPENTILTYGKKVEITPSGSVGHENTIHALQIKLAKEEDLPK